MTMFPHLSAENQVFSEAGVRTAKVTLTVYWQHGAMLSVSFQFFYLPITSFHCQYFSQCLRTLFQEINSPTLDCQLCLS